MAKEQSIETLLRRSLGKDAADALLAKIDRMVASRARPAAIEKAITADLQKQFVQQVVSAAVTGIGPVTPVKVRGVQAKVRPVARDFARLSAIGSRAIGSQAIGSKAIGSRAIGSRAVHSKPGPRRVGRTSRPGR